MRRPTTLALFATVLAATTGLAVVVGQASSALGRPGADHPRAAEATFGPGAAPVPSRARPTAPAAAPPQHVARQRPALRVRPELVPGRRLLGPGDRGPQVRALQARLRQIAWWSGDVTDEYGPTTTVAVRGFQAKRGIAVTGYVDRRTQDRLTAMTHAPTSDELANRVTVMGNVPGPLDARCRTGRALCIDKATRTLRWVVDGNVLKTVDVRFGASYSPTRDGLFHVYWKSRDHVSRLYGSAMPYAMFFSGGQAVHYSSDFAARGYSGASHGCVNVRDLAGVQWLFDHVRVGDKVVVYWS